MKVQAIKQTPNCGLSLPRSSSARPDEKVQICLFLTQESVEEDCRRVFFRRNQELWSLGRRARCRIVLSKAPSDQTASSELPLRGTLAAFEVGKDRRGSGEGIQPVLCKEDRAVASSLADKGTWSGVKMKLPQQSCMKSNQKRIRDSLKAALATTLVDLDDGELARSLAHFDAPRRSPGLRPEGQAKLPVFGGHPPSRATASTEDASALYTQSPKPSPPAREKADWRAAPSCWAFASSSTFTRRPLAVLEGLMFRRVCEVNSGYSPRKGVLSDWCESSILPICLPLYAQKPKDRVIQQDESRLCHSKLVCELILLGSRRAVWKSGMRRVGCSSFICLPIHTDPLNHRAFRQKGLSSSAKVSSPSPSHTRPKAEWFNIDFEIIDQLRLWFPPSTHTRNKTSRILRKLTGAASQ